MREFASGQIKKGVRSIGMGGDGATWGNYALVYRDADTALFDAGFLHYSDTGNDFSFTAVGVTTPVFWDGSALYLIALSQHTNDITVWGNTAPSPLKPPSTGSGSNQAEFLKFAKPITSTVSVGIMAAYELSEMNLNPISGAPSIRYKSAWRPSGGAGIAWYPDPSTLMGIRIIMNNDYETRTSGGNSVSGTARSNEFRIGISHSFWEGNLLDVGAAILQRSNDLDSTSAYSNQPTFGMEQAMIPKRLWVRFGRDENSWTGGMTWIEGPLKVDIAYLKNLADIRTGGVFGSESDSIIGTFTLAFDRMRE